MELVPAPIVPSAGAKAPCGGARHDLFDQGNLFPPQSAGGKIYLFARTQVRAKRPTTQNHPHKNHSCATYHSHFLFC